MVSDRFLGNVEPPGHVRVGQAARHQGQHFELAGRQLGFMVPPSGAWAAGGDWQPVRVPSPEVRPPERQQSAPIVSRMSTASRARAVQIGRSAQRDCATQSGHPSSAHACARLRARSRPAPSANGRAIGSCVGAYDAGNAQPPS